MGMCRLQSTIATAQNSPKFYMFLYAVHCYLDKEMQITLGHDKRESQSIYDLIILWFLR